MWEGGREGRGGDEWNPRIFVKQNLRKNLKKTWWGGEVREGGRGVEVTNCKAKSKEKSQKNMVVR